MKKVSLFFTTPVRTKMESSGHTPDSFAKKPGIQKAISLPTELLQAVLCFGLNEDPAKRVADGAWKYFDRGHQEYHDIEEAMQVSQRMESTVSFFDETGNLLVNVCFFRKAEKSSFFAVGFYIHLETGHVGPYGYGQHPRKQSY